MNLNQQIKSNSSKTIVYMPRKKLKEKPIDQDYLMYNSPEDEDQLRCHVQDNYSNTDTKLFIDSF